MALTQKMYLGEVPVIKNYLGDNPISSFNSEPSVITDGLVHYFDARTTATPTAWYSSVSNRTGSYVANVSYNSTDKVIEFNSSVGTPSLQFTLPSPFSGNPPAEHTVIVYVKPKAESALMNVHWFGRSSGTPEPNSKLQLSNSSGTNYLKIEDETAGTYTGTTLGEVTINQWHQIGYTFSGSAMNDIKLYLDSNEEQVTGITNTFNITSQYWEMGAEGGAGAYSGSVGAVLLYDRALSHAEMQLNYTILSTQFG